MLNRLYSFQPAPFFVLDEVDAALDNSKSDLSLELRRKQDEMLITKVILDGPISCLYSNDHQFVLIHSS